MCRMHWLVEQGLAAKWALLVMIPCVLILVTFRIFRHLRFSDEGEHSMEKKQRSASLIILASIIDVTENISGNLTSGALLANAFYI